MQFKNSTELINIEFRFDKPPEAMVNQTIDIQFTLVDVNVSSSGEISQGREDFQVKAKIVKFL